MQIENIGQIMKRTLLVTILTLLSVLCLGQDKGALKFLGIPVDGTEYQFASELKSKGFSYNSISGSYKGQFNGKNVDVYIHTNHNLVDRIYVAFPKTSEDDIKIEFNTLLSQFNDTGKYIDLNLNNAIPEGEDISYELAVSSKRYQAGFSYFNPDRDPVAFANSVIDSVSEFFTEDQLAELKEYCNNVTDFSDPNLKDIYTSLMAQNDAPKTNQNSDSEIDEKRTLRLLLSFMDGMKSLADGEVWFMIHEDYGRYHIGLYYDNLHNIAHGEDL